MAYEKNLDPTGRVSTLVGEVSYRADGKPVVLGQAWIAGDELECYGKSWTKGVILDILDTFPANSDGVPENMYYCVISGERKAGWAAEHQITFDLRDCGGAFPDWHFDRVDAGTNR